MESFKIRKPVVAGKFYPSSMQGLQSQINSFLDKDMEKADAIACMLPHAGYLYSGRVAVQTVSHIKLKDKIIILGPNHTGYGADFSIMCEGAWETPLGKVEIDSNLAGKILKKSKYLKDDYLAHAYEHSLEVELPILQYFKPDFQIVPITFLSDEVAILEEIGEGIAEALKEAGQGDSTLIVASSDMTHYEPQAQAQIKDQEAIGAILKLDGDELMRRIRRSDISMCGYAPVIVMIKIAKKLGAKYAKLINYQTSADTTGDKESVVGYAGIAIY